MTEGRLGNELQRLRADWLRQASDGERRSKDPALKPIEQRLCAMSARVLGACAQDVGELLAGRENPCDRRR